MNEDQVQTIRTAGRVAGSLSVVCALNILYALRRLLTSPTKGNKHHPKLTGTHRYFTLLLACISGDCLIAISFSALSFALPLNTNHTMSTNLPGAYVPSCVAQGFVMNVGNSISIVFSSLGALEIYNLRPQVVNTNVYDPTEPFWQRRLTLFLCVGLFVVVVQVSLAGGMYGYGDNKPGSTPWCWIKDISGPAEPFVGIYVLVFLSFFIIGGSFAAYLRHIYTKLVAISIGNDRQRALRTFGKLSVYPFIYLLGWTPAIINRLVTSSVAFSTEDKVIVIAFHAVLQTSLGTLNFLFLSCMNRQVRNFLPGWKYCCAANRIDESSVMRVWDSSSDEEEEGNEVEVINPVMEMRSYYQ